MNRKAEYGIWCATRHAAGHRPKYIAQGLEMCAAWRTSFQTFLKDVGPRPTSRHRLCRLDIADGWNAQNCIWALPEEIPEIQGRMKILTSEGETARDLAARLGLAVETIRGRDRRGRELDAPAYGNKINVAGVDYRTIVDLAKAMNIPPSTIKGRVAAGKSFEEAVTE